MGYVDLPAAAPATGGKMQGTIVMEQGELREALDILKGALAALTSGMPNGNVLSPTASTTAAAPAGPAR